MLKKGDRVQFVKADDRHFKKYEGCVGTITRDANEFDELQMTVENDPQLGSFQIIVYESELRKIGTLGKDGEDEI